MQIQSKLPDLKTTIFTIMSKLAKDYNAINLSQGFPDFDMDSGLIKLVNDAMKAGYNQYAPMQGVFALREEIAMKYENLYGTTYHPETEITLTAGATQAIFTAITAIVHRGDEVIIFKPAYDCYEPAIKLAGGQPVSIQLQAPHYKPNWQEVKNAVSKKTKLILINTPHNPSGMVWKKKDLDALAKLVDNTGIFVLSDEVYEHIVFDKIKHHSICTNKILKERSFITASFGKIFHNTGWKMGYCAAPIALMKEFQKVHQFNVFSINHPMQIALAAYLKTPEHYLSLSGLFQEKRDLFLNGLRGNRFKFVPSQGTYFQLLDYSAVTNENDVNFAKRLVKEYGLASIPVSVFNKDEIDQKMLRFCFAKKDETLNKAIEILNKI
ncbi:MAG: methionine aminotransferase [Flavobacteriales bacterium]|nr:MAG: methionine aminotransferase [Flavobacteriales bacterium]